MDRIIHKSLATLSLLIAGALASNMAMGESQDQGGKDDIVLGGEWTPIDPARLEEMRGGFQLPSGVMLSFGIERAVFVNGELTASIAVHVSDLSRITAEEAQALSDFNQGLVVQIGDGNRFDPSRVPGAVIIQNTLDDQKITTITRMEVGSNVLGTFQDLNSSGALHDALIGATGTR